MADRYLITTIEDILNLSPEQIFDIIPDLAEYLLICSELKKEFRSSSLPFFEWVDDGETGLKEVVING